ncbi:MAG: peroxiredoxin-like family protein [Lysobacterales bacterium]
MIRNLLFGGALALMIPAHLFSQTSRNVIHTSADQVEPLLPGMQAPAFRVRDVRRNPVTFDPAVMTKPVIITFFRGGWCPYCNLHLAELRHAEQELKDMGFDIWFISIDRPELLYESLEDPGVAYTVYSDARLEATRAFGIAFRVDDVTVERYRGYDVDLEAASGENHHVLPAPSTFLVGTDGVIRFQYTNPDYTVRLHPSVLLAAARAYMNDEDRRLERAIELKHESD